jgi:hypothetical protein
MKDCRKRNSVQPEGCAASSLLCRPSAWRTSPAAPSPWAQSGSIAPSVVRTGLVRALEERARVHTGTEPPEDDPSFLEHPISARVGKWLPPNRGATSTQQKIGARGCSDLLLRHSPCRISRYELPRCLAR